MMVSLRSLLAVSGTALILIAAVWAVEPCAVDSKPANEAVAFFLIGDTHLLANRKDPAQLDDRSSSLCAGLVGTLNRLPGSDIPVEAGGGKVLESRGVIHAGDCIDTGDQANVKMQETEWTAFIKHFGLRGNDGGLRYPLYEVHGNHDGPRGEGLAIRGIIERNRNRPNVTSISKTGLHYSWDWGNVHFVNLGNVVGHVESITRKRRYASLGSLEFLISDLKDKVGNSGKPVIVTHHVDMLRYSQPLPVDDKKAEAVEWDPADVNAYYDALRPYNVAAILYGHTHARNIYRWDGTPKAAKEGIPVFNVSKSSHYASKSQAFFYLEVRSDIVVAREYQTKDGWDTGMWTPQSWSAPIAKAGR